MTDLMDQAISELAPLVGVKAACEAVGRPRATHYRQHRKSPPPPKRPNPPGRSQPRALSGEERAEVLSVLRSPEHVDEVLSEGLCKGSIHHSCIEPGQA